MHLRPHHRRRGVGDRGVGVGDRGVGVGDGDRGRLEQALRALLVVVARVETTLKPNQKA